MQAAVEAAGEGAVNGTRAAARRMHRLWAQQTNSSANVDGPNQKCPIDSNASIVTHSREAPLGSHTVKAPSRSWLGARRGAGRCAARMLSQAARAPMHEIECVERLALGSLMRELLSS